MASTLVSEYAPQRIRGRMVVWLESFWAVGWIMAALLGYFLVPRQIGGWPGWRWALLVGIVSFLAFYALVVRHGLPSRRVSWSRRAAWWEAERSVPAVREPIQRRAAGRVRGRGHRDPAQHRTIPERISIFSPSLRKRTIALWSVWFFVNLSYYGAFTWLPTLLFRQGHSLVRSFEYTLIITIAQLPGYAMSAWLIEKWGRRPTLATFLLGSGLLPACSAWSSTAGILLAGMALSFFNLGAGCVVCDRPRDLPHRDAWHRHWGGRRGRPRRGDHRPPWRSVSVLAAAARWSSASSPSLRDSRRQRAVAARAQPAEHGRVVPPRFSPA